jgi:2-polyprenyl-3-methyl-5-hydroxy-6-metoxy-1,4-benzoquinol methylase
MEPFYLLHVRFCDNCLLVQLEESISPKQIFSHYSYFSSQSKGWMKHIENYIDMITKLVDLNEKSMVIEIGSNDGYLLQYFKDKKIPVLGIEPAVNIAKKANKKGIPTETKFFGLETSKELVNKGCQADLLIGNNILAQVPDINGFVKGLKNLLKPNGIVTMEFHHLLNLIHNKQFDTICHERFSYLSFIVVEKVFASNGLTIFDVEEIQTHGGSLRIYARHTEHDSKPLTSNIEAIRKKEENGGLKKPETYLNFAEKVREAKRNILTSLIEIKENGGSAVGYGAHAEAHTLLNYCGVRSDFLDYLVDRNPFKQGKFQAGTRIPILSPDKIKETRPDYILILPWAIKKEIMNQLSFIEEWNGRFIVPIPNLEKYNSKGIPVINKLKEEN